MWSFSHRIITTCFCCCRFSHERVFCYFHCYAWNLKKKKQHTGVLIQTWFMCFNRRLWFLSHFVNLQWRPPTAETYSPTSLVILSYLGDFFSRIVLKIINEPSLLQGYFCLIFRVVLQEEAGIACCLECRTHDQKIAGSNSGISKVARKRSRSFCQKCRWQMAPKHAYTLDPMKSG